MRSFVAPLAALFLVSACHRGVEEPDPSKVTPTTNGSTSVAPSGSTSVAAGPAESASAGSYDPYAPFNRREWKEFNMHIEHEQCEEAAKKKNQLEGLADYDKKGTLLISACLMRGNVAWYRCILTTDTLEHFNWCSTRYLQPAEDVKKPQ